MSALLTCRGDPEGWRPHSRIRPFDLTPCFEEGAVLSPLLALFAIAAVVACWAIRSQETRDRSRKSLWVLRAKLVSYSLSRMHGHRSHLRVLVISSCSPSRVLRAVPT